jgi:hypothetical protein
MRRVIAIVACALALGSCRKTEPPAASRPRRVVTTVIPEDARGEKKRAFIKPVPDILDKSALGSKLAADGTVAVDESVFTKGQPIALTIWIKQSPPGLVTGVTWFGAGDKRLAHEQRPMNGAKVATFPLKQKLAPGRYRAEGYWGGNVVADKPFVVIGGKK